MRLTTVKHGDVFFFTPSVQDRQSTGLTVYLPRSRARLAPTDACGVGWAAASLRIQVDALATCDAGGIPIWPEPIITCPLPLFWELGMRGRKGGAVALKVAEPLNAFCSEAPCAAMPGAAVWPVGFAGFLSLMPANAFPINSC